MSWLQPESVHVSTLTKHNGESRRNSLSRPDPAVLHVQVARALGYMHAQVRSDTVWMGEVPDRRLFAAISATEVVGLR